jgi:hypothetical protein
MNHAEGESSRAETCAHDAHAGPYAHDAACSGQAETCGAEAETCCGGHGHDMFAFPTTEEVVTVPATQLAGLLDLVEKLVPDPRSLVHESDYVEAQRLLGEQAPRLVELRDEFLERMKSLLSQY